MYVSMCSYIYIERERDYIHAYLYISIYLSLSLYIYIERERDMFSLSLYIYIYLHMCVYIYIYREREIPRREPPPPLRELFEVRPEHYPRDPDPEIRTREATGDNAFHTCFVYVLN